MTYKEAIDWLFVQFPVYQNIGKLAYKANLDNTYKLVNYLGNPEKNLRAIHVAGTNGKGSTSHMLASVLQEAGYKVGLYTSPHLKDFRERIKINGKMISQESVVNFVVQHQPFFKQHQLSFFEMTVGMAFQYFASAEVDIAVIEVGLGGRLDSTNIIMPQVSVITNIGLDHTKFLGDTLAKIAAEKAGIIKKQVPCVVGETTVETKPVFEKIALQNNAPLFFVDQLRKPDYKTDLKGSYQQKNIKTALAVIKKLQQKGWSITAQHIMAGLLNVVKNTGLQGRWQVLNTNPYTVCDTAHNKEGLVYIIEQIKNLKKEKVHFVLGFVNDKNLEELLKLFPKNAAYYFTRPNNPRAFSENLLFEKAKSMGLQGKVFKSVNEAFNEAKSVAASNEMIYVGGSTFVVAEVI